MRDVHSMKKEINKLLQEIEILKKEFHKVPTENSLKTLKKKIRDGMQDNSVLDGMAETLKEIIHCEMLPALLVNY